VAKQQSKFFRTLPARCKRLVTAPQQFRELYPDADKRMPSLRTRQGHAKIMALHCQMMDLESQRVGSPRVDGSFHGLSEKQIALRTGLGDPRVKTGKPENGNWKGKRTVQRYIHQLRSAGMLWWGKGSLIERGLACNPRYKLEKGPKAGTYRLFPSIRKVSLWFIERVQMNRTYAAEVDDLRRRRAGGQVSPIVDIHRRRARDREIKMRQRAREREERMLVADRERSVAAREQRSPRRNE
jgi:hypothetical protein